MQQYRRTGTCTAVQMPCKFIIETKHQLSGLFGVDLTTCIHGQAGDYVVTWPNGMHDVIPADRFLREWEAMPQWGDSTCSTWNSVKS